MRATRLRTEYLKEPLGLGIRKPRFYWNCEGGITQTAYQIVAVRDGQAIWDTGRVESGSMTRTSTCSGQAAAHAGGSSCTQRLSRWRRVDWWMMLVGVRVMGGYLAP